MFPLERTGEVSICLPYATSNEIIKTRKGGREYLQSETRFMQLLGKGRVDSLRDDCHIIGYTPMLKGELESMIESSEVDIKKLKADDVVKAIKRQCPNKNSVYLCEESFDYLKTDVGLPISNDLLDPIAVEHLERMTKHIMEETDSLMTSLDQLNRLLQKQDPPIQKVIDAGVLLPKLVGFLQKEGGYELQLLILAVYTLRIISRGKSEHVEEIVQLGAIPPLVHLLGSSHSDLSLSAACALGNISGTGTQYRDLVLQVGVMEPLLNLLGDHRTSDLAMRKYTFLLSNVCRYDPKPDFNLVSPALSILKELINHSDEGVVEYACWALSGLTNGPNEHIQAVIDVLNNTGLYRLVELLDHPSTTLQTPALRTVGNVVTGNESQTQIMVDNNVLPRLRSLLSSSSEGIQKNACWAISNITAGTKEQIQAVIDSDIIPRLIPLLSENPGISKEAAWAVTNAIFAGSTDQIKVLVSEGCIPPLLDLLTTVDDVEITYNILGALEKVS